MTYADDLFEDYLDDIATFSDEDDYLNEDEAPALPEGDGTWRLGLGWEDHGYTHGYFVAMTQGDYDWEEDAEYGELVGKWTDHETGVTHIDRVDWFPHRETAVRAGRTWEQLAIWDIAAGEEIRLDARG